MDKDAKDEFRVGFEVRARGVASEKRVGGGDAEIVRGGVGEDEDGGE